MNEIFRKNFTALRLNPSDYKKIESIELLWLASVALPQNYVAIWKIFKISGKTFRKSFFRKRLFFFSKAKR
jgi:hypothetical protein